MLILNAIALGCLGLPASFATLGMVPGVIVCLGVGVIAAYTSYTIGLVKIRYPQIAHYADIGYLLLGNPGGITISTIFVCLLVMVSGSHCLTGAVALSTISQTDTCTVIWSVVSAIALFLLAIPPTFTEQAILGYIDFASILSAVAVTVIATGIQKSNGVTFFEQSWSAWPREGVTFSEIFVAINNIVFAYAYGVAQPSFMDEMHTPQDYMKSIYWLTGIEMVIYTLTGSLIYAFVGPTVQSPALLSAGPLISRVAFGLALPVIFISGSINTVIAGRFLHGRYYKDSVIRYINTKQGWASWLSLIGIISIVAWVVAEAIPFFSELLSLCASLFISGFSFYFPPIMWYFLIREGDWCSKKNLRSAIGNGVVFMIGLIILGVGTYSSINSLVSCLAILDRDKSHSLTISRRSVNSSQET